MLKYDKKRTIEFKRRRQFKRQIIENNLFKPIKEA